MGTQDEAGEVVDVLREWGFRQDYADAFKVKLPSDRELRSMFDCESPPAGPITATEILKRQEEFRARPRKLTAFETAYSAMIEETAKRLVDMNAIHPKFLEGAPKEIREAVREETIWAKMKESMKPFGPIRLWQEPVGGDYVASFGGVDQRVPNHGVEHLEDVVIATLRRIGYSDQEIEAGRNAGRRELMRKACGSGGSPLENRTPGYAVSPGTERVEHVIGAPCAAAGHDRNTDCPADLTHEEKVVAAKAAIAAYARDKKLPGAKDLALFRELDEARQAPKTVVGVDTAKPGDEAVVAVNVERPGRDIFIFDEASRHISGVYRTTMKIGRADRRWRSVEIERDNDRLSSEALGRAADQLRRAQGGHSYADFVGTREQRLAEVLD
jgi:hypothetical protein